MAKVSAVEIRVGNLIEWDKRVWRVLKCYHVHVPLFSTFWQSEGYP